MDRFRCHSICAANVNSCCSWSSSHWICPTTVLLGLCQALGLILPRQVKFNASYLLIFDPRCSCQVNVDTLLPMQLFYMGLTQNMLVGTLPESWSKLTNVSHCLDSMFCKFMMLATQMLACIQCYLSNLRNQTVCTNLACDLSFWGSCWSLYCHYQHSALMTHACWCSYPLCSWAITNWREACLRHGATSSM